MAKVQSLPGGRKKVRIYDHRNERRGVHVGKLPMREAESIANHIQALVNSKIGGLLPDAEHVKWAGEQKPRIIDYLAGLELIPKRQKADQQPDVKAVPTLDDWFSQYIANRPGGEGTKAVWNRAKDQAVKFFGKDRRIDTIKTGDTMTWAEAMQKARRSWLKQLLGKWSALLGRSFDRQPAARGPLVR